MNPRMHTSMRLQSMAVLLVSMASIAFEVMLTRYFAIASFSEFGYWVISMAMVGYAFSGVVLALFRTAAVRRHRPLLFGIPVLLMIVAIGGFHFTTVNPFNPLALENPLLWQSQLVNIGLFYLALFPFYFLIGAFLGLNFMAFQGQVMGMYAADLIGAGIGAILILLAMFVVHPFYLVCAIPPCLFLAGLANLRYAIQRFRVTGVLVAIVILGLCEAWVITHNRAQFFEYKGVYTALHVADNRVVEEIRSPKGYDLVLDNFTERRDIPMSNNLGLLQVEGPPSALGLYRDGNRVASLPKPGESSDTGYIKGALCTLPYLLHKDPRVLLVGSGGGFRVPEVAAAGGRDIVVLESDRTVYESLQKRNIGAELHLEGPQSFLSRTRDCFDVIDIGVEYLDEGKADIYAFTRECVQKYYRALEPGGVISIPVTIRQFPGYAVKVARTAVEALEREGVHDPQNSMIVYRSEWIARVLISKGPFSDADIQKVRDFCSARSFDTPYFPRMNPQEVEVWNESPPFTLDDESADTSGVRDSLMNDLPAVFRTSGKSENVNPDFDLGAFTNERPFLYSIVRLDNLKKIMRKLDQVPQTEIGLLVSYCVLAQAVAFAALVCLLPLFGLRRLKAGAGTVVRGVVYFAGLGLAFLFVEITLIERFTLVLNDAVSSFAIVLSCMLVFSGMGSSFAGRFAHVPRRGALIAAVVVAVAVAAYWLVLDRATLWVGGQPFIVQCLGVLLFVAPLSFAMGMPFSCGLRSLEGPMAAFVPMAWGINGAFSVIASPLAAVLAFRYGYHIVMLSALVVYTIVWAAFPVRHHETEGRL